MNEHNAAKKGFPSCSSYSSAACSGVSVVCKRDASRHKSRPRLLLWRFSRGVHAHRLHAECAQELICGAQPTYRSYKACNEPH
eukprot:2965761-Pleurochrysis_carterae.AAC.2